MTFNWAEDTIRWYQNASDFTGFYKNIAETIAPMLSGFHSLCDLGCGLGLVDLELASRMERIDCIDINAIALAALTATIKIRGIQNVYPHLRDCDHLDGQWDVAYMSFFGSNELDRFLPVCKKLIAVVAATSGGEMFPSQKRNFKRSTVENTEQYLRSLTIEYKLTHKEFEFGQPFSSLDDARKFVLSYSPHLTEPEMESFFSDRMVQTNSVTYPFFIPRSKTIGIFEIAGKR